MKTRMMFDDYAIIIITKSCFFSFLFSLVLYYWTLFFPTLSGSAILLTAAMLGGYGGLICGLLFPWLARSIFTQYHRMTTYQRFVTRLLRRLIRQSTPFSVCVYLCWCGIRPPCRLPNPVYLGTLIAGLFHSLLCFYGKIMPNILDRRSIRCISWPGMFCVIEPFVTCWCIIK